MVYLCSQLQRRRGTWWNMKHIIYIIHPHDQAVKYQALLKTEANTSQPVPSICKHHLGKHRNAIKKASTVEEGKHRLWQSLKIDLKANGSKIANNSQNQQCDLSFFYSILISRLRFAKILQLMMSTLMSTVMLFCLVRKSGLNQTMFVANIVRGHPSRSFPHLSKQLSPRLCPATARIRHVMWVCFRSDVLR